MSRPSLDINGKEDWKGWTVATRDHEVADPCKLMGFALGMKVDGLSREELISNLKIFTELDASPKSHTELSCYVGMDFTLRRRI
jgi:arginine/lysine/ornithine decarboxylase